MVRQYLRMAGYMFLALCGLYAWLVIEAGWRRYAGIALFIVAAVRLMTLLKQRGAAKPHDTPRDGRAGADGTYPS